MAKFRVYNVQLLPVDDSEDEVGVAGYKKLLSLLREKNREHLKAGTEGAFHYRHSESVFIGPADVRSGVGFMYGNFVRYTKTDAVHELATNKQVYKSKGRTGITERQELPFVFDAERHLFAIDSSGVFPAAQLFGDELSRMLSEAIGDHFPKYELTVNVLSKKGALEQVFAEAKAYSVVDLDLTFRNGHDTEELLRELKETQTKSLKVRASAGKGGRMSGLPTLVRNLLVATATGLGSASMTYYVSQREGNKEVLRQRTYASADMPRTFQVNKHAGSTEEEFFQRALEKLRKIDLRMEDEDEDG